MMFTAGDIVKHKRSQHTRWQVLAVLYDGTFLAKRIGKEEYCEERYKPRLGTRRITRPEAYHKIGEADGA
jgi:hypothetical protein